MSAEKQKTMVDKEEMAALISKLAKEIIGANKDLKDIVLVGIMNRGVPIAHRIAQAIEKKEGVHVPVGSIDVSLYRDDIRHKGAGIEVKRSDMPFSIDGKTVVLVDDVIFAGRTIRAALDVVTDYGRASKIELAALIDRGHRELPVHPDFTGKKIETEKGEEVLVNVSEIDGVDKVIIK